MKALILNSGMGSRMGKFTAEHPKCMTDISKEETILSRQLKLLCEVGITDVVITTGYFKDVLIDYCNSLNLPINYTFVHNEDYSSTNYIYSIYCAKDVLADQNIIMMHGDLVFEKSVLCDILNYENSCMKVSSTLSLPEKDFKAVVQDGLVKKVGVEFFDQAMEAQALYKLNRPQAKQWLDKIIEFCESDNRSCYAEKALNEITDECIIYAYDVKDRLCAEIDTPEDWEVVCKALESVEG
ncbi:MAG: NTP transferase domain-containing protein [Clostridia bacterium]|nr:NTP transferase domain-containing protein [Clostridia bacterium]